KARLWSTEHGTMQRELVHDGNVFTVLFSPQGRTLLTANGFQPKRRIVNDAAFLWDVDAEPPKTIALQHGRWVGATAFSADGKLVVTGSFDGTARIWDADTGQLQAELPHKDDVVAVAFDPEGVRVVTGCADGTAQVWDVTSRQTRGAP